MIRNSLKSLICIILLFVCLGCIDKQITELTNRAIKDSPQLQDLDRLCSQIQLPPDFRLIRKGSIDDQKISFSYYYDSKTEYLEV